MSSGFERNFFIWEYFKWHYGKGLKEFWGVTGNFLWFIANFFSFKLLCKTLFAPWKRMGEHYTGSFDLGAWASATLVTTIMRLVGFVTKTIVLGVGFLAYFLISLFAILIFMIWLLAPFLFVGFLTLAILFFIV